VLCLWREAAASAAAAVQEPRSFLRTITSRPSARVAELRKRTPPATVPLPDAHFPCTWAAHLAYAKGELPPAGHAREEATSDRLPLHATYRHVYATKPSPQFLRNAHSSFSTARVLLLCAGVAFGAIRNPVASYSERFRGVTERCDRAGAVGRG
jgi:hypothetical protein